MASNSGVPSAASGSPDGLQVLLAEYEHCAADIRNYDSVTYQIPTVGAAALYAAASVASAEGTTPGVSFVGWLIATVFLFSLTVGLRKHRYFQMCRVDDLITIVRKISSTPPNGLGYSMHNVPIKGRDVVEKHRNLATGLLVSFSAYECLYASMRLMTGVAFVMLSVSGVTLICRTCYGRIW